MPEEKNTISYDPATGNELGRVPLNDVEDVRKAIERARIAQQAWTNLSFTQRGDHFKRIKPVPVHRGRAPGRVDLKGKWKDSG